MVAIEDVVGCSRGSGDCRAMMIAVVGICLCRSVAGHAVFRIETKCVRLVEDGVAVAVIGVGADLVVDVVGDGAAAHGGGIAHTSCCGVAAAVIGEVVGVPAVARGRLLRQLAACAGAADSVVAVAGCAAVERRGRDRGRHGSAVADAVVEHGCAAAELRQRCKAVVLVPIPFICYLAFV